MSESGKKKFLASLQRETQSLSDNVYNLVQTAVIGADRDQWSASKERLHVSVYGENIKRSISSLLALCHEVKLYSLVEEQSANVENQM